MRLALANVLLVRTLAVWRVKRDEKKANRNAAETQENIADCLNVSLSDHRIEKT